MKRLIKFINLLIRNPKLPRWAKGLLVISLLPIPGPFDEALGIFVAAFLVVCHRDIVTETWRNSN